MNITYKTSNIAKGLCCIFVLISHFLHKGSLFSGELYFMLCIVFGRLSNTAMFGFLFLSGYGLTISYKKHGLDNFFEKKVDKLFPPIIIANMFGLAMNIFVYKNYFSREMIFEGFVLRDVYYPKYDSILWYIHLLFLWYIVWYLVYRFVKYNKIYIFSIVYLIIFYFLPEVYGLGNVYSLAFLVGVVWAEISIHTDYKNLFSGARGLLILFLGCCGYIIVAFCMHDETNMIYNYKLNFWAYIIAINIALLLSFSVVLYISSLLSKRVHNSFWVWLGNVSYLVYVMHGVFVVDVLRNVKDPKEGYIIASIGVICTFVVAYIYNRIELRLRNNAKE